MVGRSTSRVYIVNQGDRANEELTWKGRMSARMGHVKKFLGKHFCDFCSSMPSIALVLCALFIILLVLSVIPLAIFVLMSSSGTSLHSNTVRNAQILQDDPPIRTSNSSWVFDKTDEFNGFESSYTRALVPKNITSCSKNGFACVSTPSIVIGQNQRCDGKHDCPDGSDESDCHSCLTSFSCPAYEGSSQLLCLRGEFICDGTTQCPNGEDESNCRNECPAGEYKCNQFKSCIPESYKCDGEEQCALGDDEKDCKTCNGGAKFCKVTNTCIPIWKLCDGVPDCSDLSDEKDCDCKTCSSDENALCAGSATKMCIKKREVCDGISQCPMGEDEIGCAGKCSNAADVSLHNGDVQCDDGSHFPWKYACSGLYPQCNKACAECNTEMAFQCKDKSACVHRSRICNRVNDCLDGSDEKNCTQAQMKCDSEDKRCDGFKDCEDGRDEEGCGSCKNGAFKCKTEGKCVHSHERCDGIAQCFDESDEADCSCTECSVHPFSMYMCEQGNRCFRSSDICEPHTRCPNPTRRDKMYCATRNHQYF